MCKKRMLCPILGGLGQGGAKSPASGRQWAAGQTLRAWLSAQLANERDRRAEELGRRKIDLLVAARSEPTLLLDWLLNKESELSFPGRNQVARVWPRPGERFVGPDEKWWSQFGWSLGEKKQAVQPTAAAAAISHRPLPARPRARKATK